MDHLVIIITWVAYYVISILVEHAPITRKEAVANCRLTSDFIGSWYRLLLNRDDMSEYADYDYERRYYTKCLFSSRHYLILFFSGTILKYP